MALDDDSPLSPELHEQLEQVFQLAAVKAGAKQLMIDTLRGLDWTIEPPEPDPLEGVPFVMIGAGERAPWADEPLTCPECGQENLPLKDSDPPGLQFISHCGKSWARGNVDFDALTGRSG